MSGLTWSLALARGLALRCPRCGEGLLFRNLLLMHRACSQCGYVYERAPGFFLGSAYLNYGFTCATLTAMYLGLHYGLEWSNQAVTVPLVIYFLTVPFLMFRYARSLWLAMDTFYDAVGSEVTDPYQGPAAVEDKQP